MLICFQRCASVCEREGLEAAAAAAEETMQE